MRSLKVLLLAASLTFATNAQAAFGINAGTGIPYLSQVGLDWTLASKTWGFQFEYNILSLSTGLASASLTKPEIMAKWHPMQGSFFLGLGIGQQVLSSKATDATTGQTAEVSVTSMALTPTLGWMWGSGDGGLWFGLDFGMVMPSGATVTITSALPDTNQAYIDARNQGRTLGETQYTAFGLKLGYLF